MKTLSLLLSILIFSSSSFACDSPAKERDLFQLFHVGNKVTTWRSVRGKGFVLDRGNPITVLAARSIKASKVTFKKATYSFEQVKFCLNSDGTGVELTHPVHGKLRVSRYGRGEKSYVRLKSGFLSFNLRPEQYTKKTSSEL